MNGAKEKNVRHGHGFLIGLVLISGICLLFPVWQSAVNFQLSGKLAETEAAVSEMTGQKNALTAEIAKRTTPEYLIEQAIVQNINFTQIEPASVNVATNF